MKKKLNEADIANELRDASLFFRRPAATEDEVEETPEPKPRKRTARTRKVNEASAPPAAAPGTERKEEPVQPAALEPAESPQGTPFPPLDPDDRIEAIRKAVKQLGKEATFSRFTQEEKSALGDVVYTYKRSGIRTSENEIIRIAVNWLLADYHSDGQNSVLAQVLGRLNA